MKPHHHEEEAGGYQQFYYVCDAAVREAQINIHLCETPLSIA